MMCMCSEAMTWADNPLWVTTMALVLSAAMWLQKRQKRSIAETRLDRTSDSFTPDIGELIRVESWEDGRHTEVRYCGKNWRAKLRDGSPSEPGAFRVSCIEGDSLILEKDSQRGGLSRY